jgi:hypothetical protein
VEVLAKLRVGFVEESGGECRAEGRLRAEENAVFGSVGECSVW